MGKWLGRPSCVVCALWRVCVVEAGLAGPPRPQVAARFGVGISSAIRWVHSWHERGGVRAKPRGGDHHDDGTSNQMRVDQMGEVTMKIVLAVITWMIVFVPFPAEASSHNGKDSTRPKVGLVLAGGGATGVDNGRNHQDDLAGLSHRNQRDRGYPRKLVCAGAAPKPAVAVGRSVRVHRGVL